MPESSEYLWKWVTASELLSHGACELLYAFLTVYTYSSDTSFYDGENTNGKLIATIKCEASMNTPFKPPKPVYCRRGLYVTVGSKTKAFVQWRELSHKGSGG